MGKGPWKKKEGQGNPNQTMKKFILAAVSLLAAVAAHAVPVTFQVDLANQINADPQQFTPGTSVLTARGSFNAWGSDFVLEPISEGSTIYAGARDITGDPGSTVEYKFVINNGADAWESFNGNRTFTLSDSAQTLPIALFNNPTPVTFQVNMGPQIAAGAFDPAAGDLVELRGAFNNWSGGTVLEPSAENGAIYTTTVTVSAAPGSAVPYKFVIVKGADLRWEGGDNRTFTQTADAQTLPIEFFDRVSGVPAKAAILFQVDMNTQIAAGNFDTATHQVWIRGSAPNIGWGDPPQGLQLFEDASRPGIYTNIYRNDALITGQAIEFKATLWKPGVTWEDSIGNRRVTFEGNEPLDAQGYRLVTIPVFHFDDIEPGEILTADTLVTFRVDMRNALTTEGAAFDPVNDSVFVNGSFLPGGWAAWGTIPFEQEMFDGGTNGDEVANDGIYSWQTTLPRGASARLVYKYSINNADNEAAAGNDHIRYVRATGAYVLPLDAFGTMTQETLNQDLGEIAISRGADNSIVLTWQGAPGVKLQRMTEVTGGTVETIASTDGQSRYETTATGQMAFFRLVRE